MIPTLFTFLTMPTPSAKFAITLWERRASTCYSSFTPNAAMSRASSPHEKRAITIENFMSNKTSEKAKEGFFEVTEADYQGQLAEGIEEEFLIKPGQYKFFRGRRSDVQPESIQTAEVTLTIPQDVLTHFENLAAKMKTDPSRLMTDALRDAVRQ